MTEFALFLIPLLYPFLFRSPSLTSNLPYSIPLTFYCYLLFGQFIYTYHFRYILLLLSLLYSQYLPLDFDLLISLPLSLSPTFSILFYHYYSQIFQPIRAISHLGFFFAVSHFAYLFYLFLTNYCRCISGTDSDRTL